MGRKDKVMSSQFMDSYMNFRMSLHDKQIIEMAAKLKGLKPNTYARQKLLETAQKDIEEINQFNVLTLSDKDWEKFISVMESPVQINQNLKQGVSHFKKMKIK